LSAAEIAEKVVKESLIIREDDQVIISGWEHTLELAEAIALECRLAGAIPFITIGTDGLYKRTVREVPEDYLKKVPKHLLAAYDVITAAIWITGPKDSTIFHDMPPTKMGAVSQAEKPLIDRYLARRIRAAVIQSGLVTAERASVYGIDFKEWKETTNSALIVDYSEMRVVGQKVADAMRGASEVEITSEEGTNLTLSIKGRPVLIHDGVVDEEDIEMGFHHTNLPAGSVVIAPIENSADGRVVFDAKNLLWGKVIKNLTWTFEDGKLAKSDASENPEIFREVLGTHHGDKDKIGELRIGMNPNSRFVGYEGIDSIVEGAVSIGIGDNRGIRGSNDSDFTWLGTMTKAAIKADGREIVTKGKLQI